MKKAAEEGDKKTLQRLEMEASQNKVSIEIETVAKDPPVVQGVQIFFNMLTESYANKDEESIINHIQNFSKEHTTWFSQAYESILFCKGPDTFKKVSGYLFNSVIDRHLRYAIAAQACEDENEIKMF